MERGTFLKLLGSGLVYLAGKPVVGAVETQAMPENGETQTNAHFVNHGPGFGNRVALTYDDGPSPGVTDIILKELDRRQLKATFFMIGKKVRAYPSLAREVAAAGHELANHTFTHPSLSRLSNDQVISELRQCQEAIGEVTGQEPVWFRPPYGAFRKNQGHMPRAEHLGVAYWSVDPRDWSRPGISRITHTVLNNTRPGSIILLHDLHRQTAEATPTVLDGLEEKDFFLTPMSGLLGDPYGPYAVV